MGLVSHHSSGRASYHYLRALRDIGENMMINEPDFWKVVVILIGIGYLIGGYV